MLIKRVKFAVFEPFELGWSFAVVVARTAQILARLLQEGPLSGCQVREELGVPHHADLALPLQSGSLVPNQVSLELFPSLVGVQHVFKSCWVNLQNLLQHNVFLILMALFLLLVSPKKLRSNGILQLIEVPDVSLVLGVNAVVNQAPVQMRNQVLVLTLYKFKRLWNITYGVGVFPQQRMHYKRNRTEVNVVFEQQIRSLQRSSERRYKHSFHIR